MLANQGRKKLALGLACLVSIIVIIMSLGITLPQTPFDTVELDGPVLAASDGHALAIVDSASHRILLLDENYELTRIVDLDGTTTPLDAFTDICVKGGRAYASGVSYLKDSGLIEQETLVSYGLFHAPAKIVKEWKGEHLYKPHIKGLNESDAGIFVTTSEGKTNNGFDYTEKTLVVTLIKDDGSEEVVLESVPLTIDVFSSGFDYMTDTLMTVSLRGIINDDNNMEDYPFSDFIFTDIDCGSNGCIYATDETTGAVYKIDREKSTIEPILTEARFDKVNVNDGVVCAVSLLNNAVTIADFDGNVDRTITSVKQSLRLQLFVLAVRLSWLILIVSIVVLIVLRLRTMFRTQEAGSIGSVLAGIAIVASVSILIATTSYNAYQDMSEARGKEISAFADILSQTLPDVSDAMEAIKDRGVFHAPGKEYEEAIDNYNRVIDACLDVSYPADINGIGTYFTIYGKDDFGVFVLYDSTNERAVGSSVMTSEERSQITRLFGDFNDKGNLHEGRSVRDSTLYRYVQIPSTAGDGTVGIVEFGSRVRSFMAAVNENVTEGNVERLVLLFVVYIVYAELRGSGRCLLTYMQLKDEDKKRDAIALLTRPFTFIVSTLIACDSVMSTLIARSMVSGAPDAGFLIALPAALQGVGLVLGQIAYGAFAPKAGVRRIVNAFSAFLVCAAGVAIYAVSTDNFACYLACKLALGISFGLLYTLGYSLPRQTSLSDLKAEASGGVRRTDTSAAALGTITGGYVAQLWGNECVYLLLVIGGATLICFARLLFLPMKHAFEGKNKPPREMWVDAQRLFGTKDLIALIVCIMVPVTLASGYGSFIFPLFCADIGLSKVAISRVCVLSQLVVYILIDGIEYVTDRYGRWRTALMAVVLVGSTFLLLSFNAVFTLAVATVVLVGVFCKTSDAWKGLWGRQGELTKTPANLSTGLMYATRSAILIVQPLIMSTMVKWPNSYPPLMLALCAFVGSMGFYLLTRGSKIREA